MKIKLVRFSDSHLDGRALPLDHSGHWPRCRIAQQGSRSSLYWWTEIAQRRRIVTAVIVQAPRIVVRRVTMVADGSRRRLLLLVLLLLQLLKLLMRYRYCGNRIRFVVVLLLLLGYYNGRLHWLQNQLLPAIGVLQVHLLVHLLVRLLYLLLRVVVHVLTGRGWMVDGPDIATALMVLQRRLLWGLHGTSGRMLLAIEGRGRDPIVGGRGVIHIGVGCKGGGRGGVLV